MPKQIGRPMPKIRGGASSNTNYPRPKPPRVKRR